MRGKVGFYINHGVEVRYFILSGIVDLIKENNEVVFYVNKNHLDSKILNEYSRLSNIVVNVLPSFNIERPKFEMFQRAFTNARKRASNIAIYNHFGKLPRAKFYDILFKLPIIVKIFEWYFRHRTLKYYKNEKLLSYFKDSKISKLYLLQYDTPSLKFIGINGALSGANVFVFMNTLKTIFIDDFVSIPISKLFSWNHSQNILFQKANLGLDKEKFIAKGNPYHNFLRVQDNEYNRRTIEKYSLKMNRPIIVYSLINEKVYDNEHLILEMISKYLDFNFDEEERPQLVIRRNPFEQDTSHIAFLGKLSNVIVADHFWERNEKENWSIQAIDGELEWRSLLQIASLNVNIPSMSTIDAIVCGTPVLNVAFDQFGDYNDCLNFLIESPFNIEFEKYKFVKTARNYEEFKINLLLALKMKENINNGQILETKHIVTSDITEFI